jgi:hypothetical protein
VAHRACLPVLMLLRSLCYTSIEARVRSLAADDTEVFQRVCRLLLRVRETVKSWEVGVRYQAETPTSQHSGTISQRTGIRNLHPGVSSHNIINSCAAQLIIRIDVPRAAYMYVQSAQRIQLVSLSGMSHEKINAVSLAPRGWSRGRGSQFMYDVTLRDACVSRFYSRLLFLYWPS